MDLSLNLWNILKNFLIYIFVRYLSYSLLKIHRKLIMAYLLCDKVTLMDLWEVIIFLKGKNKLVNGNQVYPYPPLPLRMPWRSCVWFIFVICGMKQVSQYCNNKLSWRSASSFFQMPSIPRPQMQQAEEIFKAFRRMERPYALCKHLLGS
jgi:hypothetical protein